MSAADLECIELETTTPVTHSVIWLHGLGASGDDFVPVVPELDVPENLGVRFIFPHAPVRPITINNGMAMRGWYDITSLNFDEREQDLAGTQASADAVDALIEQEISRGVPAANIVLAGFSQGGAIALFAGLTSKHRVAGILALSTYLPLGDTAFEAMTKHSDDRNTLPIFFAHGSHDEVILLKYAKESRDALLGKGFDVNWSTWPMAHSVMPEEIVAMSVWFKTQWRK